jgi:uncharacterized cupin superfamily protein
MANQTTTRNSEGSFEPFNIDNLPWEQFPGSDRFKRVGRYAGGTNVGTGIDELGPGQYSNQFHYHLEEEEHIFILKGSATLYLGNHSYALKEGDYCCFPAGQRAGHHLYNHTDSVCTFMTIGENKPHEVCYFPKSGAVRIRATGDVLTMRDNKGHGGRP